MFLHDGDCECGAAVSSSVMFFLKHFCMMSSFSVSGMTAAVLKHAGGALAAAERFHCSPRAPRASQLPVVVLLLLISQVDSARASAGVQVVIVSSMSVKLQSRMDVGWSAKVGCFIDSAAGSSTILKAGMPPCEVNVGCVVIIRMEWNGME
jgi:hypothetical protein